MNEAETRAEYVGMYFAETIRKNHPSVVWDVVVTGSKRYVYYGQPIHS